MADETPKRFPFPAAWNIDAVLTAAEQLRESEVRVLNHSMAEGNGNWDCDWDMEEEKSKQWVEELRNVLQGDISMSSSTESPHPSVPSPSRLPSSFTPPPLWAIVLSHPLPSPILKGRFFECEVQLESLSGAIFPEHVKVPVTLSLVSADDGCTEIEQDYTGGQILSGQRRAYMRYDPIKRTHVASFRISILTVTTNFPTGFLCLRINITPDAPTAPSFENVSSLTIGRVAVLGRTQYMARRRKEGRRLDRVESRFSEDEGR